MRLLLINDEIVEMPFLSSLLGYRFKEVTLNAIDMRIITETESVTHREIVIEYLAHLEMKM